MIVADTSTWIAFLDGVHGEDVRLLVQALNDKQVLMIPVVLTELLSAPDLPRELANLILDVPMLDVGPGFWHRAGLLRGMVLGKGRKARLGDALVAQSCIDHGVPLLSRDRDFKAFAASANLNLVVA